jgi:hypothetical protein
MSGSSAAASPDKIRRGPIRSPGASPGRERDPASLQGPGTETVQWNAPFLNGDSFQLSNISSQVVGTGTGCPVDHPVEVNVSGTISATSPGTKQYDGSPVTATICSNQTDFILKPGTLFVIHKK